MNFNSSFKELHEENLLFPPSDLFKQQANISSLEIYEQAKKNPETFWESQAKNLAWIKPWNKLLEWNPPYAKWFIGGKINACYNCIDRHLNTETRNKNAIIWESENGEKQTLTYLDLYNKVCQLSNVFKSLGIKKGDTVAIYLPMIPEAIIAMLACARIGAVHTVIFAGFSADSIKDRILDSDAKLIVTADGGFRRGKVIHLKETIDLAAKECPSIQNILVIKHTHHSIEMLPSRDYFYDELMKNASIECPPEIMDAEDILFILYTSGTTGKAKGIVHTTGGYMVGVNSTTKWVFDIKSSDIYWCTADIGWITGHSYIVYGPLSNGMTQLIYEGTPDFPDRDCFWKLIEKHKVTILYTAPTAIRTFMKWGEKWIDSCNLSSLRLLGTVGEPINPEAWMWYYKKIGKEKCQVVDTWWQTETGSIMIAPIPGIISLKPGSATLPLPGIEVAILNETGEKVSSGYLAITKPWPSMLRGIHKDPKRYEDTYWKKWSNDYYFTGDGAKQDPDGYFWLMGRVDDVINVSGHRLGTMEIESALVDYNSVAEAAVIAVQDEIKGQAIVAFVTVKEGIAHNILLEEILKEHIVKKIGAIARPKRIIFTHDLPKTRSGKIMRRLLRDIGEGKILGDISTLTDISIVQELKIKYEKD